MADPVKHYLITITLQPRPSRLHAYVMTNDERVPLQVAGRMVDEIERRYGLDSLLLPAVLQTHLDKSADEVRTKLGERLPEAKALMAEATDFHCSMWEMPIDDPWDESLMALH